MDLCSPEQHVLETTRNDETEHILNLLLSNTPDIISNPQVIPSISDHKVVEADVNVTNTNAGRSKPRKVFLYSRAVYDSMAAALDPYFSTFEILADELSMRTSGVFLRAK